MQAPTGDIIAAISYFRRPGGSGFGGNVSLSFTDMTEAEEVAVTKVLSDALIAAVESGVL